MRVQGRHPGPRDGRSRKAASSAPSWSPDPDTPGRVCWLQTQFPCCCPYSQSPHLLGSQCAQPEMPSSLPQRSGDPGANSVQRGRSRTASRRSQDSPPSSSHVAVDTAGAGVSKHMKDEAESETGWACPLPDTPSHEKE